MAKRADITPELCRQLLRYEPETGKLFWRHRPRDMFATQRAFSSWNTKHSGAEAFVQVNDEGYLRGVMMRHTFRAQRVAWAVYYGKWPDYDIDHINGVPGDNRIVNLRDVPRSINNQNLARRQSNLSGATGVSYIAETGKWRATIRAEGKNIHLGVFAERGDAIEARKRASSEMGFHQNHGRHLDA